ncbi:Flp pilus assembly protein TadG [Beijerinckia sp. GAS462]|nr:Flp pilus assembly protein TadG [Beijerinckia sp. GAS462]SED40898.1 TadE-like protein [Beijerinckia sp. 28-YEA-48]
MPVIMQQGVRRIMATAKPVHFINDTRAVSAMEFALVAPLLLFLLLGIACFGYILGVHHELQQIASEAARASVAGTTATQRDSLARSYITTNASDYLLINSAKMAVTTTSATTPIAMFQVAVSYDLTGSLPYLLGNLLPLPSPQIQRTATIQQGNY